MQSKLEASACSKHYRRIVEREVTFGLASIDICPMKWREKFNRSDTKRGDYFRSHTKNYPELLHTGCASQWIVINP